MAKSNPVTPPPPASGQDYLELDRFPPRRGNPKEARRTALILAGSIGVLVTGMVLRATVFKARFLAPPVPQSEVFNQRDVEEVAATPAPTMNTPIAARLKEPGAKTRTSRFNRSEDTAGSTDTTAITTPYTTSAPVTGTATGVPAPIVPATTGSTAATGQTAKEPYTTYSEPPVTPSLRQTGGSYQPSYTPPALPTGRVGAGLPGGTTTGTTTTGSTATGTGAGTGIYNTPGTYGGGGSGFYNGSGNNTGTTGTSTNPPRF